LIGTKGLAAEDGSIKKYRMHFLYN